MFHPNVVLYNVIYHPVELMEKHRDETPFIQFQCKSWWAAKWCHLEATKLGTSIRQIGHIWEGSRSQQRDAQAYQTVVWEFLEWMHFVYFQVRSTTKFMSGRLPYFFIPRFHGEASDVLFLEFLHQLLILSGIDHASLRAPTGTIWLGASLHTTSGHFHQKRRTLQPFWTSCDMLPSQFQSFQNFCRDLMDMLEILNLQLSKNALAVLYSHYKKCSLKGAISSGIQNSEHHFSSASRPSSQAAKIDQSAEEDGIWPQIANFLKTWRSHFEDYLCLERLRFGDARGSWRPLSSRLSVLEGLTTTVPS